MGCCQKACVARITPTAGSQSLEPSQYPLWDYEAFEETDGLLPCAFQTSDVRRVDGDVYLDATRPSAPNDMLVAHHINAMQYVATR